MPGRRLELKGCLVAGPHSFSHVGLSKELATANPELTLPMFCGKSKDCCMLQVALIFTHVSLVKELNQLERERERKGGRERERERGRRGMWGDGGWRRGERKTDQKRVSGNY